LVKEYGKNRDYDSQLWIFNGAYLARILSSGTSARHEVE
jgi:hypothetical protein